MASQGFPPSASRRSFCTLLLLLSLCGVGLGLYFDDLEAETRYICAGDLDTFKLDLSTTYRGFGYEVSTVFVS